MRSELVDRKNDHTLGGAAELSSISATAAVTAIKTAIVMTAIFAVVVLAGCSGGPEETEPTTRANIENGLVEMESLAGWLDRSFTDSLDRVDLASQMAEMNIPGLAIVVIDDFEISHEFYYGVRNTETNVAIDEDTIFQSGSTTKLLAGVLILQLVERGALDLDVDVNQYLTTWKMPVHESGTPVTLRHLLTHTAGINRPGDGIWHEGDTFPTLEQVLNGEPPATSEGVRFNAEPGTEHAYSNHGYLILQKVIEDHYGASYTDVVEQEIFGPLQMRNSCIEYPLPAEVREVFISGHDVDGTPSLDDGLHPYALAQGGWMASPEDVALFGIELMRAWNGKSDTLLGQEAAKSMMSTEVEPDYDFEGGIRQQGLGCLLLGEGEDIYFFHHGHNSPPGANCILIGQPATGKGAVVMTNGMRGLYLVLKLIPSIANEFDWASVKN